MTLVEQFGHAKYVSLTTVRRDGTGVSTPVWLAVDGPELFIVSEADAWKVKRIRRDGHVTVTVCDARGRTSPGALSAEGTARVLDDAGTRKARKLIAGKYLSSRVGNWLVRVLHLPKKPVIGIAVAL